VINNLNFEAPPNSKIAIIGRTGSGKSSLFNALLKMSIIDQGSVKIGGIDLNTLDKPSTRALMAYIPQEPFLFKGTLRQNFDP